MHASEHLPIESLGCDGMKGNRLNGSGFSVGTCIPRFVLVVQPDAEWLGTRGVEPSFCLPGSGERLARYGREWWLWWQLKGGRTPIVIEGGPTEKFPPHIVHKAVDSTLRMMAVWSAFGHDENMAFVLYSQGLFQCPKKDPIDICIWIRMFIH